MRDWARERNVRYLVVLIPAKYHVDDGAWRDYRRAWGLPESSFDRDHARREVVAFLAEALTPPSAPGPTTRNR